MILWDDLGFPPSPSNLLVKKTLVWHSSADDTASLHDIPYWALITALESFGLGQITQRIWFVATFWLMGVSMYFLTKTLFPNGSRWSFFFSGLIYMFNPVLSAYQLVGGTRPLMLAYAFAPLALAL